ncbi:MAG: hypothetical protein GXO65_05240 [Euryarchaeota archaeon]|nr:hypothetical protein [Euryarchaeota archaeon]
MGEVNIKVDVPVGLEKGFEKAIDVVLRRFIEEVRWETAEQIIKESKLTEERARYLANEVKESIAKRHGVL